MKRILLILIFAFFATPPANTRAHAFWRAGLRDHGCYFGCSSALSASLRDNGCSSVYFVPLCDPDGCPFASSASLRDNGCSSALSASLRDNGCSSASPRDNGCSSVYSVPPCDTGFHIENDTLPQINQEILAFVNAHMKKKVGRGECWDLAAGALNASGAKWNGKFQFGRKLEKDEAFLPGDIIQFEGVKIKYEEDHGRYTQTMKHHTGIIYSIKGSKQFDMANQNTKAHGKKVSITFVDLEKITSGHYSIYRPVR